MIKTAMIGHLLVMMSLRVGSEWYIIKRVRDWDIDITIPKQKLKFITMYFPESFILMQLLTSWL